MTTAGAPTVFVIDDDAAVRTAIQGLLKSVGLQSQCFRDHAGVPEQQAAGRAELPGARRQTSWSQRPGLPARAG